MKVESFFVLLCKSLDFARHNVHFQVSVEVIVSDVASLEYGAKESCL
jgi:hypothetical protein